MGENVVLIFWGVHGAADFTCSFPQPGFESQIWGGMVWYTPKQHIVVDRGVFCDVLLSEADRRNLTSIAYVGLPEIEDVGSFEDALVQVEALIG